MSCLFLVQSLCSSGRRVTVGEEACWVYVYKAVVDFVEHPQAVLLSSFFRLVRFNFLGMDVRVPAICPCSCWSCT